MNFSTFNSSQRASDEQELCGSDEQVRLQGQGGYGYTTPYLRYFFLVLVVVLSLCVAVEYAVDPADLFESPHYYRSVAAMLLANQNVAGLANHDERLVQKFYIEGQREPKELLVLGSSRSLQLRSDHFDAPSFLNHSMSGGTLEDYLALYQMLYERRLEPKTLILGIDPWVFNRNNRQIRWESLRPDYERAITRLNGARQRSAWMNGSLALAKYKELLSLEYLTASLKLLLPGQEHYYVKVPFFATDEWDLAMYVKRADGSLVYPRSFRTQTAEEVRLDAYQYAHANPVYSLGNFARINSMTTQLLEQFIQDLVARRVSVTLFLPPYHPVVFRVLASMDEYANVLHVEEYLRGLARQYPIAIKGSYDPRLTGCAEDEFYDGMHPKGICIRHIFESSGKAEPTDW